jgi:hypothetical protein
MPYNPTLINVLVVLVAVGFVALPVVCAWAMGLIGKDETK